MRKLWIIVFVLAVLAPAQDRSYRGKIPKELLDAKSITVVVTVDEELGKPEDRETFAADVENRLTKWGRYKVVPWEHGADLVLVMRIGTTNGKLYAGMTVNETSRRLPTQKHPYYKDYSTGDAAISWVLLRFEEAVDAAQRRQ